jgi:hypothetical protein
MMSMDLTRYGFEVAGRSPSIEGHVVLNGDVRALGTIIIGITDYPDEWPKSFDAAGLKIIDTSRASSLFKFGHEVEWDSIAEIDIGLSMSRLYLSHHSIKSLVNKSIGREGILPLYAKILKSDKHLLEAVREYCKSGKALIYKFKPKANDSEECP